MDGVERAFPDHPFFKEFALSVPDAEGVRRALADRGFLVGPVIEGRLLVACTERRTREEIDALADAVGEVLG